MGDDRRLLHANFNVDLETQRETHSKKRRIQTLVSPYIWRNLTVSSEHSAQGRYQFARRHFPDSATRGCKPRKCSHVYLSSERIGILGTGHDLPLCLPNLFANWLLSSIMGAHRRCEANLNEKSQLGDVGWAKHCFRGIEIVL